MLQAVGTEVAVSVTGHGFPLLCLHAIAHGGGDFDQLRHRLADKSFRIVTLDWPGQGRSPSDAKGRPPDPARYADIAAAVIEQLFEPDERPIVIGNSIGGAAAIILASRLPQRLRALVLCNPGGLAEPNFVLRSFCRLMATFFRGGDRGANWYPAAFSLYYRLVLPRRPARAQRDRIVAACRETAGVLAGAWAGFAGPESDLRPVLAVLQLPILFAWARNDKIVSWGRSRKAVKASGAKVIKFPGGHSPFLESPDCFAEALQNFCQSLVA